MSKLTIVTTCTSRKTLVAPHDLLVRNLVRADTAQRVAEWRKRLNRNTNTVPLTRLYSGESWARSLMLVSVAAKRGYSVRLLVASAGLGLKDLSDEAPGYGATFSPGQLDFVQDPDVWWQALSPSAGDTIAHAASEGSVLIVLSAAYGLALAHDLRKIGEVGGDILLVGGRDEVSGIPRLKPNAALAAELGGPLGSLNQRTAAAWLERAEGRALADSTDLRRWLEWSSQIEGRPHVARAPMDDDQLRQFVSDLRHREPRISHTGALRLLRESGRACEQSRFRKIFKEVADRA